jgi:hypothetical protein
VVTSWSLGLPVMTEYDSAHREQIRQALLSYMKEHKIGVPRLAARIKETVHRNPEIPVKTLQRFMKGEVRTIDMHVGFIAQFAEKLSKGDETPRLGFALSAFYSSQDKTDCSGSFNASELESLNEYGDPYRSKILIAFDQGTWRVREVGNYGRSQDVYEGALTTSGSIIVMVMKDRLLGLPRTMTVSKQSGRGYEGVATAAYFPGTRQGSISPLSVRMRSARISLI